MPATCDWASALWLQQHSESAFFWDTLYSPPPSLINLAIIIINRQFNIVWQSLGGWVTCCFFWNLKPQIRRRVEMCVAEISQEMDIFNRFMDGESIFNRKLFISSPIQNFYCHHHNLLIFLKMLPNRSKWLDWECDILKTSGYVLVLRPFLWPNFTVQKMGVLQKLPISSPASINRPHDLKMTTSIWIKVNKGSGVVKRITS